MKFDGRTGHLYIIVFKKTFRKEQNMYVLLIGSKNFTPNILMFSL